ncbi:MAG: beta-ketoacyl-ACP synthase III [Phycisphaerae bacterium]
MARFGAYISGSGSCVPQRRLTNADLEKLVDTNDEWIVQRTGIRERRVVSNGESTVTLALHAAQKALENAKISADDLDLIIVATLTPELITPSTACLLQEKLGIKRHIGAFDMGAACSGFVYSIATASQFIQTGAYKNILIVGAETLTRIVDYTDRGTCILFGDGAGAVVLSATEDSSRGIQAFELGADGMDGEMLYVPAGGSRLPASAETILNRQHYLKMNGREIYKFAVHQMTSSLKKAMEACNLTAADVKLVVPHQVNQRIIDSATEKMGFPKDKVFVNIDRYGNTSAASVPLALDEALRAGACGPGDWIIMVAFGAGLTWASATVKL